MLKLLNALLPALLVVAFGAMWLNEGTRHDAWVISDENQPIELITFGALLVGGCWGFWHLRELGREGVALVTRMIFGVICLGLVVVAMEEISWGQWFLKFETPELVDQYNLQNELNLHNLKWTYGKSEVMRLAFGIGGIVGLLAGLAGLLRRIAPTMALLPWLVVIAFNAAVEFLVGWYEYSYSEDVDRLVIHVMPELTEMLIGLAGLGYIIGVVRRGRAASEEPA